MFFVSPYFFSGKDLESLEESSLEKVKTNNKLRSVIKSLLAQIDLFSLNIDKRLSSAKNILQNVSKDEEEIINKALSKEKNSDVKEILFEAKKKNFVLCGDSFYMKLKIVKELNPNINLIEDKWFEVNKDYQGKYIFPVNLKLKKSEINDYLLGIESVNETTNCQNNFFSYDLIKTKEVQYYYAYPIRNDIKIVKSELFNHYSLNYKIYYK